MKKAFVAVGLLLLCSSAVSASPAPELASFINSLGGSGSCPAPMQAAAKKDGPGGGVVAFSYCQASCGSYNVSCSGDTCSAVDRNCGAGQQGYVQCDGAPIFCHSCNPPQCNEGWQEWRDGGCCGGGYQEWLIYECIGGMWQHVDTFCDSVSCF